MDSPSKTLGDNDVVKISYVSSDGKFSLSNLTHFYM